MLSQLYCANYLTITNTCCIASPALEGVWLGSIRCIPLVVPDATICVSAERSLARLQAHFLTESSSTNGGAQSAPGAAPGAACASHHGFMFDVSARGKDVVIQAINSRNESSRESQVTIWVTREQTPHEDVQTDEAKWRKVGEGVLQANGVVSRVAVEGVRIEVRCFALCSAMYEVPQHSVLPCTASVASVAALSG